MATLLLQAAGAVAGSFLGPVGAIIGRAAGAVAGAVIDNALFTKATHKVVQGPRLSTLQGIASTEGAAIPRLWGRARIGGQMIWATRFEEVASTTTSRAGSSGGKGGGGSTTTTTSYTYFANVAIGLCEGPIAFVRRIWADGKEIDQTRFTIRVYRGDETQSADALIVAKEGTTPAYRGQAYVVFERMPLADFGNRVPQFAFEVTKPVDGLAAMVRGVDLIPGASEFAYATDSLTQTLGPGQTRPENRHQLVASADWTASLDALQALCPNLTSVALVVAWFGDDLRCGQCTIAPRVEIPVKQVSGTAWSVAGLTRSTARLVSQPNGRPAYGGSPSDASVMQAIGDLKARGLSVLFYPFVMMDVPADNALPDPWTGAAPQPAFPWRGRITCDPAPGQVGSPNGTSAAGDQVAVFFGAHEPGTDEWSFRRFILHCAALCVSAGGVDAFLVGSELAALTRVRAASGVYPAANALAALAQDVKVLLGDATRVSYAADWTEYGAHVRDGGAEVRFPLDVVWGSPHVDFVGIDAYWPLSDWRDGAHADNAEAASVHDLAYLTRRVAAGEAFDWYYADAAARDAQMRTTISDGTYGKPWVFRQKDLVGFWSNAHVERVGGAELSTPTAWVPKSKPIWLVETGCPAVDRGANAPNVFPDAKSSESALPYYSRGYRDDLMQARALEATIAHFDPTHQDFQEAWNPASTLYDGRMVEPSRTHVWCWDARPFPAFPMHEDVWADVGNWGTGHWVSGRLEGVPLDRLVQALVAEVPDTAIARPPLDGFVDGYVLDRVLSPRGALEPLATLFGFDGAVTGGAIAFRPRTIEAALTLTMDDLVPAKDGALVTLTRGAETELPHELAVTFATSEWDYRAATALSVRLEGYSNRDSVAEAAVVSTRAEMQRLTDLWLQDAWVARESARFAVRPTLRALEIGDAVTLPNDDGGRLYRITRISDGATRAMEARAVDPAIYDHVPPRIPAPRLVAPVLPGPPRVVVLDLAIAQSEPPPLQWIAVFADPWPGPHAVFRSIGGDTFTLQRRVDHCALIGNTLSTFGPGPVGRIDPATTLTVSFARGGPASVSDTALFGGANAMAIQGSDGAWEVFGFANAELVAPNTYRLSRLLRGLGGAEALASRSVPVGATVVLLDDAVVPLTSDPADLNVPHVFRVGPASRDYADDAYVALTATANDVALQPYAPVQVRAARTVDGIAIDFVRRGRWQSDAWEPLNIPLGETSEAYAIDIRSGASVPRTLIVTTPHALYAHADELADFGATQSALALTVAQISTSVGRGFSFVGTVAVH